MLAFAYSILSLQICSLSSSLKLPAGYLAGSKPSNEPDNNHLQIEQGGEKNAAVYKMDQYVKLRNASAEGMKGWRNEKADEELSQLDTQKLMDDYAESTVHHGAAFEYLANPVIYNSKASSELKTHAPVALALLTTPSQKPRPPEDITEYNDNGPTWVPRRSHSMNYADVSGVMSFEQAFRTVLYPRFQVDLSKDGFERINLVEEPKVYEGIHEFIEKNKLAKNDSKKKAKTEEEEEREEEEEEEEEDVIPWTPHHYFTFNEMKLLKKYLNLLRRKELQGQGGSKADVDRLLSGSMGVNRKRKAKMLTNSDELVRSLVQMLWRMHLQQPQQLSHTFQIKSFPRLTPRPPITAAGINRVEQLELSLDEIASNKNVIRNHSTLNRKSNKTKLQPPAAIDTFKRVAAIFSLLQPVGHQFYTPHEIDLLDSLYKASFAFDDGSNYHHNLKSVVSEVFDKFHELHKHPLQLHTKQLSFEWLLKAPQEWLDDLLLPLLSAINAAKLSSKDVEHVTSHFFAATHSSTQSHAHNFMTQRHSTRQILELERRLELVHDIYPQLDSLIDRHFDVINYLVATQKMTLKRYKKMAKESMGDDYDILFGMQNWNGDDEEEEEGEDDDEDDDDDEYAKRGLKGSMNENHEDEEVNKVDELHGSDGSARQQSRKQAHAGYADEATDGSEEGSKKDGMRVVERSKREYRLRNSQYEWEERADEDDNDNEIDFSLTGRRISVEKLFENMRKIKESSLALLEKEHKLLGFFDFENLNRFFEHSE